MWGMLKDVACINNPVTEGSMKGNIRTTEFLIAAAKLQRVTSNAFV
jgi:hypothetical protein